MARKLTLSIAAALVAALSCSAEDSADSGEVGDGGGDADVDGDADGDADGGSDVLELTEPHDGARFFVREPVHFAGYTEGALEVTADEEPIGSSSGPGEFAFDASFEAPGSRSISFWVDGALARTITIHVDPRRAKVCLDPGHPSYEDDKLFEALINRKVAFFLEDLLLDEGFDVLITVDDVAEEELFAPGFDNEGTEEQELLSILGLGERAARCNGWPADYFLSIHHNAVDNPEPNYSLVLYGAGESGSPWFPDAVDWAALTASRFLEAMEVTDAYARSDQEFLGFSLAVLGATEMIGILTEGSFYSNPAERARLNDDAYLEGEARAIFDGFLDFVAE